MGGVKGGSCRERERVHWYLSTSKEYRGQPSKNTNNSSVIRRVAGMVFMHFYRRKKLHYVGRDLRGRLKQHLRDKHGESWDRFSMYFTVGDDHIRELESLVLRIVRPTGNRQVDKFSRAQNLRRDFARRVRQDAAEHLGMLLGTTVTLTPHLRVAKTRASAVLAPFIHRPLRLRGTYKGKVLKARVLRNGVISFCGKRYQSPSTAALAALPTRRAINGWSFWKFERAPGDWVRLKELRK
jgi:hypothetical protein